MNDPCNSVGFIRFEGYFGGQMASVTGYLVGFDPPRVLAELELPVSGAFAGTVTVDRRDLEGAPTCEELRSALAFVLGTDESGRIHILEGSLNARLERVASCNEFTVLLDERIDADRVRLFAMLPGSGIVEGPISMEQAAESPVWSASAWPDVSCAAGHVLFGVAHRGGYLAAAQLEVVGQP